MPKLPPPALPCLNASGSIADYRPYRQLPDHRTIGSRPKLPESNCVAGWRQGDVLIAASVLWDSLSSFEQTAWASLARRKAISLRMAFLSVNLALGSRSKPFVRTP